MATKAENPVGEAHALLCRAASPLALILTCERYRKPEMRANNRAMMEQARDNAQAAADLLRQVLG